MAARATLKHDKDKAPDDGMEKPSNPSSFGGSLALLYMHTKAIPLQIV